MFAFYYPTALKRCRGIIFTHGVRMGGRKKFVGAIYQKLQSVGTRYLVGTLFRGCRCPMSCCDLDLTFNLAVVTLTYKILSRLYLGNREV